MSIQPSSRAGGVYVPPAVVSFDHLSMEYTRDPYPTYTYLREHQPVFYYEPLMCWIVSGYDDIVSVLKDPRISNRFTDWEFCPPPKPRSEMNDFDLLMKHGLFALSREDHHRVRKLAIQAFSPRLMGQMKTDISDLVSTAYDGVGQPTEFDFAADIARVLPGKVIAKLVGIPKCGEEIFESLSKGIIRGANPYLSNEERAIAAGLIPDGLTLLRELIEERRAEPKDDFITTLLDAEEDGERLGSWEMLSLITALIAAGVETAQDMHMRLALNLLTHRDQLALLKNDFTLMQSAISETLRYDMFGKLGLWRFAKEDIKIKGQTIRKGQMVSLMTPAANRDPAYFDSPDVYDICRDQQKNISFGLGHHYCLGAAVAKAQGEVVFKELIERFPHCEVVGELEYEDNPMMRRLKSLHIKTNVQVH